MPFLRLRDLKSGEEHAFESAAVRIGRDPASEYPIAGEGAKVVSASHARLAHDADAWWIEDLGSRNGTFLDGRRLEAGARTPLPAGAVIGLGESGPRLKVEAMAEQHMEATMAEVPAPSWARPSAPTLKLDSAPPPPPPALPSPPAPAPPQPSPSPAPPRAAPHAPAPSAETLRLTLREARTGEQFDGKGGRIRLGRGRECEVHPVGPGDTTVSRVHAEIVLKPDGKVVVRDAKSRNGTFINGKQLTGEHALRAGDHILLGEGGPDLILERLALPGAPAAAAAAKLAAVAIPPAAEPGGRRSFGGKGATVFFKEMMEETDRRTSKRIRWIVWSFVGLLAAATGGIYWWSETRMRQATAEFQSQQQEALAAQRRAADSVRRAAQGDYERLRAELDSARSSAAPAAVVDSLRRALNGAQSRTSALEASLQRATTAFNQQLAAGDSLRRQAQAELARLRGALSQANAGGVSSATLDSLRRAVQAAEMRANSIEARMRAVKGVDLAALSQANQAAVGLVTGFGGGQAWNGSGFVISRSGYFVTNRHVAMAEQENTDSSVAFVPADSLFITMADQQLQHWVRVAVVAVYPAGQPDLALLRIPNYAGPSIAKVDWPDSTVRQGEAAALIGFPTGEALAYDAATRTVRTSMSAGIFSKVTSDRIQFDGFTVGGSSGSPVFNANGEVVAVHAAGLRDAVGLGFAVPVKYIIPLLPADAKAELDLR
jgi:pSer/pThr/pTyr-binding forkhead associated (FHA) protein/S1-C subfamily serine protease